MQWWSFRDLHPKKETFLFDCFGLDGFKEFLLQDDKKTLNKVLYGIKKFEKKRQENNGNKFNLFCGRA